jgi:hypothetical protein|eukprot:COSAG06_NODE_3523_length_5230_cov_3.686245_5_plen_107_part_00
MGDPFDCSGSANEITYTPERIVCNPQSSACTEAECCILAPLVVVTPAPTPTAGAAVDVLTAGVDTTTTMDTDGYTTLRLSYVLTASQVRNDAEIFLIFLSLIFSKC